MTEAEIDDLAATVARLTPDEAETFERAVSGLRAERARAEEARIEGLRAMTDDELVDHVLTEATERAERTDGDTALAMLRDDGFLRGEGLQELLREAYRYGFRTSGPNWHFQGQGRAIFADEDFLRRMVEALAIIQER